MPKQLHLEDEEQKLVIAWAAMARVPNGGKIGDDLFAIPNGGARRPVEAMILKACGVKAGVPDLCYSRPCGPFHGLYVEMKKPRKFFKYPSELKRSVSKEQLGELARLQRNGYAVAVCFGFDEARRCITSYIQLGSGQYPWPKLDPENPTAPTWGPTLPGAHE